MPRPRSESFYVTLAPEVTKLLSLSSKASISRSPSPPHSPTTTSTVRCYSSGGPDPVRRVAPSPPTMATTTTLPLRRRSSISSQAQTHARKISSDADDESDKPKVNRFQSTPSPVDDLSSILDNYTFPPPPSKPIKIHPWSPRKPSPLRRNTLTIKPLPPSALYTASLFNARVSPQHHNNPDMQPGKRKQRGLYSRVLRSSFLHSPEGGNARRFGLRTAWRVDEEVRGALRLRNVQWLEDDVHVVNVDDPFTMPSISPPTRKDEQGKTVLAWSVRQPQDIFYPAISSSSEESSSGSDGAAEEHSEFSDDSSEEEDSDSDYEDGEEQEGKEPSASWEIITL